MTKYISVKNPFLWIAAVLVSLILLFTFADLKIDVPAWLNFFKSRIAFSNILSWSLLTILSGILVIIGLFKYRNIWKAHKSELPQNKWQASLDYLIAFIPNHSAKNHIISGVVLSVGLSLFLSYLLGFFIDEQHYNRHSISLGLASMVFSILLGITSFWTLHQTKKIEHQTGIQVTDFRKLIKLISEELHFLFDDMSKYQTPKKYHRIFFISEHPFFGMMSYPSSNETAYLKFYLDRFLQEKKNGKQFSFEILCGDGSCAGTFIEDHFLSKGISKNDPEVQKAKNEFESNILPFVNANIATRKTDIPDFPQFIIVGNKIFEFVLKEKNPQTEIYPSQIYTDSQKAELYIQTFNFLKKIIP